MAARINKIRHDENTRRRIQCTQLIKRLQMFAFGEKDPLTGQTMKMDSNQLKAIEILLRKAMPDLSAVEGSMTVQVNHDQAIKEIEELITIAPVSDNKVTFVN